MHDAPLLTADETARMLAGVAAMFTIIDGLDGRRDTGGNDVNTS